MPFYIAIVVWALLFLISFFFKIAAKLRLLPPLVYALLMGTVFMEWQHQHTTLAYGIFYALIGLSLLSWIIPVIRKIRDWKDEKDMEKFFGQAIQRQTQKFLDMGYDLDDLIIHTDEGVPRVSLME